MFATSCVNSLRPSNAYMRQWTNHHLFRYWLSAGQAPSHYLSQCWNIVNLTLRNKIQWHRNRNSYISVQENAFENVVCKVKDISSRPQCVNESTNFWKDADLYVHFTAVTDRGPLHLHSFGCRCLRRHILTLVLYANKSYFPKQIVPFYMRMFISILKEFTSLFHRMQISDEIRITPLLSFQAIV